MELFWATVAVVTGIVSPFLVLAILIWLLWIITELTKSRRLQLETELEEVKNAAPYDDIQFSQPPNPTMLTVRLIKNKKVVWEESYDKDLKDV